MLTVIKFLTVFVFLVSGKSKQVEHDHLQDGRDAVTYDWHLLHSQHLYSLILALIVYLSQIILLSLLFPALAVYTHSPSAYEALKSIQLLQLPCENPEGLHLQQPRRSRQHLTASNSVWRFVVRTTIEWWMLKTATQKGRCIWWGSAHFWRGEGGVKCTMEQPKW